jgi:hypothetical protein
LGGSSFGRSCLLSQSVIEGGLRGLGLFGCCIGSGGLGCGLVLVALATLSGKSGIEGSLRSLSLCGSGFGGGLRGLGLQACNFSGIGHCGSSQCCGGSGR